MHVVKARALEAKAKAWTLKAKFLKDPQGQDLSSKTTSLALINDNIVHSVS
jgi:hypothetical protein